jgi:dimeric dUTPase (all-alpha-NTP-PPase superfamily)
MKTIIKSILLWCFCVNIFAQSDFTSGKTFINELSDGLTYISYQVDKKTFTTNKLSLFSTYDININTFEITTPTNGFVTLFFVNNIIIKLSGDTEFRVDGFNITQKDVEKYPSKTKIESFSMNLALMDGEAYFIVNKTNVNDQFILQTPVSNLGLETGKYYIQVTKKSVLVYILEGNLEVYDNVTNKKEVIKSGNAILIHPAVFLSPKQMEMFSDKLVNSVKKVKPEQFKPYVDVVNKLGGITNEVIFINIDTNIFGVKIK